MFHFLLRDDKLAYVFVDEAYCEYHWIYYPKTEYKILGVLRKMNYSVPWIVLTDLVCTEVIIKMLLYILFIIIYVLFFIIRLLSLSKTQ